MMIAQLTKTGTRYSSTALCLAVVVMAFLVVALTSATTAGGATFSSFAAGAPIRECGDYPGGPGAGVFNITTRVTGCPTARRMARRFWHGHWRNVRPGGRPFRRGDYTCRNRNIGAEAADLRCTASGGRVVHWQHGA
jgi:hypothetical protein